MNNLEKLIAATYAIKTASSPAVLKQMLALYKDSGKFDVQDIAKNLKTTPYKMLKALSSSAYSKGAPRIISDATNIHGPGGADKGENAYAVLQSLLQNL
jgi:hypothetical protein